MKKISIILSGLFIVCAVIAQTQQSKISVSLPDGWTKVQGSVLEHQYLKNGASFMIKEETSLNDKMLNDAVNTARQGLEKYFSDGILCMR